MAEEKDTKPATAADTEASQAASATTAPLLSAPSRSESQFATPQPHRQERGPRVRALAGVLLIIVSVAAGFIGGWLGASRAVTGGGLNSAAANQRIVTSEGQLISNIASTVGPSVVSIDVTSEQTVDTGFFGVDRRLARGAGTGIILTANGVVVTNRHVVPQGTTSVSVTLSDGTELDNVEVVGRTRQSDSLDIAFLKIGDTKGKRLTPAKIGDSSKMKVGDRVVAIGNALGQFQNTVTSGIVSGYGRSVQAADGNEVETLQDLFQTDAAINQGNSGGPLVNAAGEVIGINTAVAGGGAEGIGFAIPVNNISGLIRNVIATGEFKQPYLGVRYTSLTNDIAQELGLRVSRGAYVLPQDETGQPSVVAGSPAERAGLRGGDVIVRVNNTKIDESHSLSTLLGRQAVGDEVTLKVLRDGKEQDIKIKLEAAPNE